MAPDTSVANTLIEEGMQTDRVQWRVILLLAIGARLLFAVVFFGFHLVPPMTNWGYEDIAIALSLHQGHGYSSPYFSPSGPTAFMTPGYPLFLAAVMHVFGTGALAATVVVVIQEIFSVLTVVLVIVSARLQFGNRTANIAGYVSALAPPMLMAPMWIWDTSLSALALATIFAAASSSALTRMRFIPTGAGCAIAGLFNPSLLPSLWAICAWSAWKTRKFPWAGILTFLVVFAPWPVRNAAVMHAFIPLRTDFGYELWMGNHPGGSGNPEESLNPMTSKEERQAFLQMGELRYLHEKGMLAKEYIRSEPTRFLELSAKRFVRFWIGSEHGVDVITVTLFLLAILGFFLLTKEHPESAVLFAIPLFIFPLPYYFTLAVARFQYVIDPILVVLAAHRIAIWVGGRARQLETVPDEK